MYQAINKQEAKNLYDQGEKVLLVPSSHEVGAEWSIKVAISKQTHFLPFDKIEKFVAEYQTTKRDNNKLSYYIEI